MANFAQFMTFHKKTDEPFILPDPESGKVVRCFSGWSPANLDTTRDVVLMFMVKPQGPAQLGMWFNNKDWEIYHTFDPSDSGSARSFHEIVDGNRLKRENNTLSVETREMYGEVGQLEISDIVLFYHATT